MTVEANPARHRIHPLAFVGALILAPVLIALPGGLGIWVFSSIGIEGNGLLFVLVVPVAAVIFGGIPYVLFGAPAFVIALRKGASPSGYGFLAHLGAIPFIYAYFALVQGTEDANGAAAFYLFFGSIFAPVWGAMFGWLYGKWSGGPAHA